MTLIDLKQDRGSDTIIVNEDNGSYIVQPEESAISVGKDIDEQNYN